MMAMTTRSSMSVNARFLIEGSGKSVYGWAAEAFLTQRKP